MMTGITLVPPENRLVETVRRAARLQAAAAGLPVGATWGGGDAAATPWPPVYAPPRRTPAAPLLARHMMSHWDGDPSEHCLSLMCLAVAAGAHTRGPAVQVSLSFARKPP
jgi:hypothetical protein